MKTETFIPVIIPTSMTRVIRFRSTPPMLIILGMMVLSGCSYSTQRPFRTDIQTIHVEMFHSKEFRRELEFRLTESIIKRIELSKAVLLEAPIQFDSQLRERRRAEVSEVCDTENFAF